jgi:GxxExxY protein
MSTLEERINAITFKIRAAATIVHRRIGPGCFEKAYVPCFAYEMQRQGLDFVREVPVSLLYDDLVIPGACVPDYIVEGVVVAEVKVGASLTGMDAAQLRTYLRLTGCPVGLLINFGATLMKNGIIRQVNNFPHGTERGRIPALDPADDPEDP